MGEVIIKLQLSFLNLRVTVCNYGSKFVRKLYFCNLNKINYLLLKQNTVSHINLAKYKYICGTFVAILEII